MHGMMPFVTAKQKRGVALDTGSSRNKKIGCRLYCYQLSSYTKPNNIHDFQLKIDL